MNSELLSLAPPALPLTGDQLEEVKRTYAEPERHYHTFGHVRNVARHYDQTRRTVGFAQPEATFLAVLAHDAIYDVSRGDNESRSADLARSWATDWWNRPDWGERAAYLVDATASHHALPIGDDLDMDHFLDCDLAVLGASDEVYDAYAAGIRAEYLPLAGDGYGPARAAFLREFLKQDALFRSEHFQRRFEPAARRNLRRELALLS